MKRRPHLEFWTIRVLAIRASRGRQGKQQNSHFDCKNRGCVQNNERTTWWVVQFSILGQYCWNAVHILIFEWCAYWQCVHHVVGKESGKTPYFVFKIGVACIATRERNDTLLISWFWANIDQTPSTFWIRPFSMRGNARITWLAREAVKPLILHSKISAPCVATRIRHATMFRFWFWSNIDQTPSTFRFYDFYDACITLSRSSATFLTLPLLCSNQIGATEHYKLYSSSVSPFNTYTYKDLNARIRVRIWLAPGLSPIFTFTSKSGIQSFNKFSIALPKGSAKIGLHDKFYFYSGH